MHLTSKFKKIIAMATTQTQNQFSSSQKKVLVIMSDSSQLLMKSGKSQETGFFLLELMYTVESLLDAGYDLTFTSAKGTEPHLDPMSDKYVWYLGNVSLFNRHKELLEKLKIEKNFSSPQLFSSFTEQDLEKFDAVFIPGGHAPMMDLTNNQDLGKIILHFHEKNKPIATICHGPAALLSARLVKGDWIFRDYAMTCYSNREEKINQLMWWDLVDEKLEDQLTAAGGKVRTNWPMVPHVVCDRELITGQGPSSVPAFSDQFLKTLTSAPSSHSSSFPSQAHISITSNPSGA
eukprot:TRINITY_DN7510_c0_g1_i1.p1 TRINITY_DN7510_c0_g1~~TRINITY_DN7510_c0_g1_i1.p1  ORF type:complete len:291 (+),score=66.52 TRINITY_DN7510_c0_g1_i1:179-1051(+)